MSALCPHNMFLLIFAMNQRYGCFRCMKTLPIIRIKMVVSVVQSIGIFFSLRGVKKDRLLALCSHRHVNFLFWSMSWKLFTFFSYYSGRDRNDCTWLTCVTEKLKKTKQIRCYDQILVKFWKTDREWKHLRRYCTFVPPFFVDDSGAECHAD